MVSPGVSSLLENPGEEFLECSKLLITYADNILRHPEEEKFRSIRISNPTFSTKLLPIRGAVECLFEMGFEEAETHLVFPSSASVEQLRLIRESIAAQRHGRLQGTTVEPLVEENNNPSSGQNNNPSPAQNNPSPAQNNNPSPAQTNNPSPAQNNNPSPAQNNNPSPAQNNNPSPAQNNPSPAQNNNPSPAQNNPSPAQNNNPSPAQPVPVVMPPAPSPSGTPALENSASFYVTLQSNFQHVTVYENSDLQRKAREHIPHLRLSASAKERLQRALQADPECRLGQADFLVLELLSWFKQQFFSWVDTLPCGQCGGQTVNAGPLTPTAEDHRWGAQRVESHYCQACHTPTRFPRYNNPEKLLETRRGRCGEWANCFTLCCRTLGLEARYVWDSTDHVWTEVFSASQRRWLHCDPCENVCDKPLLYEMGWGKKLAYVLAFSRDQVVDVTWRYSCNHGDVLTRRTKVPEPWLRQTVTGLTAMRQQSLGSSRRQELTVRLMVELVEFISPKRPSAGDLSGRSSGSLAWRNARGETGDTTVEPAGCVFTPTASERSQRLFQLCYSCAADRYARGTAPQETLQGWRTGVWKSQGVFRKKEADWKMVYLSRTEGGGPVGSVVWKLDLAAGGMRVGRSLSIRASSHTFHSGTVTWSLRAGPKVTPFTGDGTTHTFSDLIGSPELLIEARLSGGEGPSAWQHAQLFRESLKDTPPEGEGPSEGEEPSFELLVHLEDA